MLASYPDRRSALMPLLYLATLEHEFVTEEAMVEVAELVGITPAQVQSVASFYTMFKREPVGDYLVSVCTSITCHLLGGDVLSNDDFLFHQLRAVRHGRVRWSLACRQSPHVVLELLEVTAHRICRH